MEQRQAGGSGLWVSCTALGTMTWGNDTDQAEASDLLTAFVDAGGTLVDTADVYNGGEGERIIGRLLNGVVRRSDVIIATKTGHATDGHRPVDTSRRHLLASLDASLRRLQTDHVDLWQLHAHDPATPFEETLSALDAAVESGKARYVGVGNMTAWQFASFAAWQRSGGPRRNPVVTAAAEYSLLCRDPERDLLPAAAALGAGVVAWASLGRGVLSGKYRRGVPQGSRGSRPQMAPYVEPYLGEPSRRVVESVCTAAEGLGVSPLAVALSWVRDRPGVVSVAIGPRTAAQLDEILGAEEVRLPDEIREALDDASAKRR